MFLPRLLSDGTYADLVTPFRNGDVDLVGLSALIEWQIHSGVSGVVVCGENGETSSLTRSERVRIIRRAVDVANGAVPVMVGTGTNCTQTTIDFTREAMALGASAAHVVTPYYNKPAQGGIYRHFQAVAEVVDLPLVIVNAPGRCVVDLQNPLLERLANISSIIGLVDCTGDVTRLAQMPAICKSRMRHYSGHDRTALAFALAGGNGSFSLAANIAPRQMAGMQTAFRMGNLPAARSLQDRLSPLLSALEMEHPIVAAKQALATVLGIAPDVRLPLTPLDESARAALGVALTLMGDLHSRPLAKAS
ncbi:4-hydroxy-tetrahydrodipicolinate synthase [Rhizobium sp.]|jgi:4-hydroxy-tetrahydrodipicolinate synthase|uniref:4-hydroxy-tetrahydrodipicolinate synthase n=1 Tax=Rhizobium sp. TaxID=391 RepID=UPI000E9A7236|nr:4-hydroxy-tetrahydrodipicolinate synthase [Rhizobium sp.]